MAFESGNRINRVKSRSNLFYGIFIPIAFAFVLLGLVLIHDYLAHKNAYDQATLILQDSAAEQTQVFYSIIDAQYSMLDMIASSVAMEVSLVPEKIVPYLNNMQNKTMFSTIVLDMPDGSAYLSDGSLTNVKDREYFQQSMTGKRTIQFVLAGRTATYESMILLAVPIEKDGHVIGVLHGGVPTNLLRKMLVSEAYGALGYSFLCTASGMVLCPANGGEMLLDAGDDVFSYLDNSLQESSTVIEELRVGFAAGQSGTAEYIAAGKRRYAVYVPLRITPVDGERWFMMNVIENEIVDRAIDKVTKNNNYVICVALFFVIAIVMFIIWRERYSSRMLLMEMDELELSEQQYRVALAHSENKVFRYHIATRTSYRDTDDEFGKPMKIENVPESVMDLYAEESREPYLEFFDKLCSGEPTATVTSRMRDVDGNWRWMLSIGTTIFDKKGNPNWIIVSYRDVTEQREKEILYELRQSEIASFSHEQSIVLECNLTSDVTEYAAGDFLVKLNDNVGGGFNARAQARAMLVASDDRAEFLNTVNRERLIGAFYNGNSSHVLEYRINRDGKGLRWARVTIRLAQYPDTNDIKAYIVVTDIDEEKRKSLALHDRIERDGMTDTLNRTAFINRVTHILENESYKSHALMLIDVDHFKTINDMLGHQTGDSVLLELVSRLRSMLRSSDLIGRIGGDEFMVFFRDFASDQIEERAEAVCLRMYKEMDSGISMSVSIGAAVFPIDGNTFEDLYQCVDLAMYHVKEHGRNGYAVYDSSMTKSKWKGAPPAAD